MWRRLWAALVCVLLAATALTALQSAAGADSTCYTGCTPPIISGSSGSSAAPVTAASSGAAISGATSVHTGEPWAGSLPYVLLGGGGGLLLVGTGAVRRRRRRKASAS